MGEELRQVLEPKMVPRGELRSCNDFCLLGLDFIVDNSSRAWLLEVNAPPCLGPQSNREEAGEKWGELVGCVLKGVLSLLILRKKKYRQKSNKFSSSEQTQNVERQGSEEDQLLANQSWVNVNTAQCDSQ